MNQSLTESKEFKDFQANRFKALEDQRVVRIQQLESEND